MFDKGIDRDILNKILDDAGFHGVDYAEYCGEGKNQDGYYAYEYHVMYEYDPEDGSGELVSDSQFVNVYQIDGEWHLQYGCLKGFV